MPLPLLAAGAAAYGASRVPGCTHFVPIDDHEDDRPTHVEPATEETITATDDED